MFEFNTVDLAELRKKAKAINKICCRIPQLGRRYKIKARKAGAGQERGLSISAL
jgi:hypothetical protein